MTTARINGRDVLPQRHAQGGHSFDSKAALALPWYFNASDQTAVGDAGLRSGLAGTIAAAMTARTSPTPQCKNGGPGILVSGVVDSGAIEDAMHERLGAADRMARVSQRLAQCTDEEQHVLRLHFATRPLAFGVSGCAVLTQVARQIVFEVKDVTGMPAPSREALNEAMRAAHKAAKGAKSDAWAPVELEALALLGPAVRSYESARVERGSPGWHTRRDK